MQPQFVSSEELLLDVVVLCEFGYDVEVERGEAVIITAGFET